MTEVSIRNPRPSLEQLIYQFYRYLVDGAEHIKIDRYLPIFDFFRSLFVPSLHRRINDLFEYFVTNCEKSTNCFDELAPWIARAENARDSINRPGVAAVFVDSLILRHRLDRICEELNHLEVQRPDYRSIGYWGRDGNRGKKEIAGPNNGQSDASDLEVEVGDESHDNDDDDDKMSEVTGKASSRPTMREGSKVDKGEASSKASKCIDKRKGSVKEVVLKNELQQCGAKSPETKRRKSIGVLNALSKDCLASCEKVENDIRRALRCSKLRLVISDLSDCDYKKSIAYLNLPCNTRSLEFQLFGGSQTSAKMAERLKGVCQCLNELFDRMDTELLNDVWLACEIGQDYLKFRLHQENRKSAVFHTSIPVDEDKRSGRGRKRVSVSHDDRVKSCRESMQLLWKQIHCEFSESSADDEQSETSTPSECGSNKETNEDDLGCKPDCKCYRIQKKARSDVHPQRGIAHSYLFKPCHKVVVRPDVTEKKGIRNVQTQTCLNGNEDTEFTNIFINEISMCNRCLNKLSVLRDTACNTEAEVKEEAPIRDAKINTDVIQTQETSIAIEDDFRCCHRQENAGKHLLEVKDANTQVDFRPPSCNCSMGDSSDLGETDNTGLLCEVQKTCCGKKNHSFDSFIREMSFSLKKNPETESYKEKLLKNFLIKSDSIDFEKRLPNDASIDSIDVEIKVKSAISSDDSMGGFGKADNQPEQLRPLICYSGEGDQLTLNAIQVPEKEVRQESTQVVPGIGDSFVSQDFGCNTEYPDFVCGISKANQTSNTNLTANEVANQSTKKDNQEIDNVAPSNEHIDELVWNPDNVSPYDCTLIYKRSEFLNLPENRSVLSLESCTNFIHTKISNSNDFFEEETHSLVNLKFRRTKARFDDKYCRGDAQNHVKTTSGRNPSRKKQRLYRHSCKCTNKSSNFLTYLSDHLTKDAFEKCKKFLRAMLKKILERKHRRYRCKKYPLFNESGKTPVTTDKRSIMCFCKRCQYSFFKVKPQASLYRNSEGELFQKICQFQSNNHLDNFEVFDSPLRVFPTHRLAGGGSSCEKSKTTNTPGRSSKRDRKTQKKCSKTSRIRPKEFQSEIYASIREDSTECRNKKRYESNTTRPRISTSATTRKRIDLHPKSASVKSGNLTDSSRDLTYRQEMLKLKHSSKFGVEKNLKSDPDRRSKVYCFLSQSNFERANNKKNDSSSVVHEDIYETTI